MDLKTTRDGMNKKHQIVSFIKGFAIGYFIIETEM